MEPILTATSAPDIGSILSGAIGAARTGAWVPFSAWIAWALLAVANVVNVLRWTSGAGRTVGVYVIAAVTAYATAATVPGSSVAALVLSVVGALAALARTPGAYDAIERGFSA
jgi:hypothetical protein